MKLLLHILSITTLIVLLSACGNDADQADVCTSMVGNATHETIRHTVVFRLIHPLDSPQEKEFLLKACSLSEINTVRNFECLRQVSPKNKFTFGLSMEFDSQEDYDFYNNHPDHVDFVENVWLKEVEEFMEVDYVQYNFQGKGLL